MEKALDRAGPVRQGEEIDAEAIGDYLRPIVPGLHGLPEVRQYPGGASNLTYEISFGDRVFVLRRPPFGTKAKSAHDMSREFSIQERLKGAFGRVPEMIAHCRDTSILGSEFYVMEKVEGVILRSDLPVGLELSETQASTLCSNFVDLLIEIHQTDLAQTGIGEIGKGPGYAARQIHGWSDRFRRARTEDVPDFEIIMEWLAARIPEDAGTCLIHNDFRFDNLVLDANDPTRIVAVLDWEMATVGDPLMDLGNSLAYWVEADDEPILQLTRRQPTHLPGMWTRDQIVEHYRGRTGLEDVDFTFYRIYGLFRLAVIVQQIYYRFFHGQTKNPEFAGFGRVVIGLEAYCRSLVGVSK